MVENGLRIMVNFLFILVPEIIDRVQDIDKTRHVVALVPGEVRAAPEGFCVPIEEHRQRPAALLTEAMQRAHVDRVDVGTLFAIDFDVDEELVHHLRGAGVLKAFMRHHMAPVASRVADGEQDGLAGPLRFGECFRTPGPPMDRVVLVLKQIGAGLVLQSIFGHVGLSGEMWIGLR